jgi:outer membrane protein TolC
MMNTKKQLFSTFIFVLFGFVVAFGQDNVQVLTFEDAMQIMVQQNPALLRAKQQIKQKEYELKAKRGLHLPQVSLSAKAISMADMLHLDLTPVKDAITPLYSTLGNYGVFSGVPNPDPATNPILPVLPDDISTAVVREKLLEGGEKLANADLNEVIQEKNFASLSADFMWPLLTGGKIKGANQAAGVEVDISREELRVAEGILLTELVTRYYGLSLGIQVHKVRQQMFEGMNQHYSDAQKLFDNGMIAKLELLHATVSRNEAERELKQAERNIEIIRAGLDATLSFDTVVHVLPSSDLFINKELSGISYWVTTANNTNPQLKQIEGKRELVQIKNRVDKGSYLPTVAMIGTYNLAEKNLSPYIPDWVVGVGMKWTVFEGMGRRNKIKVGETMQQQVNFAEQKAQADIKAYLSKLYQELQMQMEQKEELESTLELAQEYSKSTEKAFSQGFATSSTVVDAYSKVAQVKALRLKVFYDYDVTLARFLQMAGVPEQYLNFCAGENTTIESITE